MKAVILAAGVGRRLSDVIQDRPKCLIELGERTLLSRYLESLATLAITQVVMIVGYQQELIRRAVKTERFPGEVHFEVNEAYERGSIGSLWAGRRELNDDVVIMDADVLYHPTILQRLVESPNPNSLLMDETVSQETEECMVVVRSGRVIALTKHIPDRYDLVGEGVGFLKVQKSDVPHLVQSVQSYVNMGQLDMEYEDALKEFFQEVRVGFEKIGGLPWIEIDFPEDIKRAEREVVPFLPSVRNEVALGNQIR